jgi:hypothetical protein
MKRTLVFAAALIAATSAFANDVDPFGFEKEVFISTKTRAEVLADVSVARAANQLPVGELGVKPVEIASVKTRGQVVAETREAGRLGLLSQYGELGPKDVTIEQARQIELAGLRAIGQTTAAK